MREFSHLPQHHSLLNRSSAIISYVREEYITLSHRCQTRTENRFGHTVVKHQTKGVVLEMYAAVSHDLDSYPMGLERLDRSHRHSWM